MKSLVSILKENLEKEPIDESKFRERRRKIGSAIGRGLSKAAKSLGDFAKSVIHDDHV